jgi:hypothetical protein
MYVVSHELIAQGKLLYATLSLFACTLVCKENFDFRNIPFMTLYFIGRYAPLYTAIP